MKNDSPKNFNCEFAAEMLDFLYGELNGERKIAFQVHLRNCSDCAGEIEDFADIRFSIQDWKAAEFDRLATPKIEIPYETTKVRTVETDKSVSWFESLRNYLTFSPVFSGAAAIVIFAVLVAAGIFLLNSNPDRGLVAETNQKPNLNINPSEKPQPSVEKKQDEIVNMPQIAEKSDPPVEDKVFDEKEKSADPVPVQVKNNPTAKPKTPNAKTVERKTPNADLKNDTKQAKTVPTKNKPRLNELPEEDEDNSLRLADLFAELETKE